MPAALAADTGREADNTPPADKMAAAGRGKEKAGKHNPENQ